MKKKKWEGGVEEEAKMIKKHENRKQVEKGGEKKITK